MTILIRRTLAAIDLLVYTWFYDNITPNRYAPNRPSKDTFCYFAKLVLKIADAPFYFLSTELCRLLVRLTIAANLDFFLISS